MVYVLIIAIASCGGMISLTLLKPKIKLWGVSIGTYWFATLLGAVILVAFGLIGVLEVFDELTSNSAINPLKILVLFLSMTILSIFLDETGLFSYLANAILRRTGTSQIRLFTSFYIAASILTVFTSNDIIILTFTPFICYFAKNAKVNPVPYLVAEFVAANTSSMLLVIGNPTNIYIATSQGIDFLHYLRVMALPTFFAVITAYFVMLALFFGQLRTPITKTEERVKIQQKTLLIIGVSILSVCTALLVISSYIAIEMWLIAAMSALSLILLVLLHGLIRGKGSVELSRALKRTPWELIPFVISMFIIVLSLGKYEITDKIAELSRDGNVILTYGISSVIFANLINNIPMSVLFSSVLQGVSQSLRTEGAFAVIIGSNIGAYLTPIGALAGIMWMQILKNNSIEYGFWGFFRNGVIIALPTLLAALLGLAIAASWM